MEPPLSQKLNRQTNGQAMEAALSWYQMSIPEQTGHHEVTPLFPSDTTATRRLSKKVPKTKEPGPILRGSALAWGHLGSQHPPPPVLGAAAYRCLVAATSSERDHAGWPDLQGISPTLVPKLWATSTPLWSSLAPFSGGHPVGCPTGPAMEGLAGTSMPTGICLRTAPQGFLRWIKAPPPTLPPDFPPPCLCSRRP